jgi:Flp pilus assembly protein TadG
MVSLLRNRRGSAVVETALVLPFLLLLIFGITEFGRAWMTVNILQTASREAARLAVVTAPDVAQVTARATAVCNAANITPTSVSVDGPAGTLENRVTVTVTADFRVIPGKVMNMFEAVLPLSASTSMRHES